MAAKKKSASSKKRTSRRKPATASRSAGDAGSGQGEFQQEAEVRTALISGSTFHAKPVQYAVIDGLAIVEGDIVLGTAEEVERRTRQIRDDMRSGVAHGVIRSGSQYRWPDCRIPYTIDTSLPNQSRVTDAIAHWESNTRFTFVARTTETDFVTFRPGSGCSSQVGRQGGQQFVNLSSACSTGNTIHEIGHVVGLWHEQSREDRDSFVTISWSKIISGMEHNFNQHITDGDDVGAYDYGSIMHYPRDAFSVDGSDTITPLDPTAVIGQRAALSPGDIAAANSVCPVGPIVKGPSKDPIIDVTIKERVKDLRLDTRKEIALDTLKEMLKDNIKDVAYDPPGGTFVERPTLPVQPVTPAVTPLRPGALGQPFAVVTPHRAPAAFDAGTPAGADAAAQIDQHLQALAEAIAQADAQRQQLQAQYDELAAVLQQALEAEAGRGGG